VPDAVCNTAHTMREFVTAELGIEPEFRAYFSIWICGPSPTRPMFEVPLRDEQCPAAVGQSWLDMLEEFAPYIVNMREGEKHHFTLRRAPFLEQSVERQCRSQKALEHLVQLAALNVATGRYATTEKDIVYLSAMRLQMKWGDYISGQHSDKAIEQALAADAMLPNKYRKKQTTLRSGFGGASKLTAKIKQKYKDTKGQTDTVALCTLYLEHVWQWPYYGATFFDGHVRVDRKSGKEKEVEVSVGVNEKGMHIFNADTNLETTIPYQHLAFALATPEDEVHHLFLQDNSDADKPDTYVVYSDQAELIERMVSHCMYLIRRAKKTLRTTPSSPLADG